MEWPEFQPYPMVAYSRQRPSEYAVQWRHCPKTGQWFWLVGCYYSAWIVWNCPPLPRVFKMAVALEDFRRASSAYLFVIGLWKIISRARKRTVRVLIKAKCVRIQCKLQKVVDISNCSSRASELSKSCPQFVAHCIDYSCDFSPRRPNEGPRVTSLKKQNIAADYEAAEKDAEILKGVANRKFNVVYPSPESMLSVERCRRMLSTDAYKQGLIGIAVDEAHCI